MLLWLSTEILEQVFLDQSDMKDIVSLGFTCSRLHRILEQPWMWRNILAKVVKDNNPTITLNFAEVEMLMKFLKTTDEPWDIL